MDVINLYPCPACGTFSAAGAVCCEHEILVPPFPCDGCGKAAEVGVLHPYMGPLNVCRACLRTKFGVEEVS